MDGIYHYTKHKLSGLKGILCIVTFVLSFFASSCQKDEKLLLAGCCGNEAVEDTFGNATVFIPNVFTPNEDGINDNFYILGDSIRRIKALEIRNSDFKIVFRLNDVLYTGYSNSWDGKIDGAVKEGLYSFIVSLEAYDGTIKIFKGRVCNFPCGLTNGDEKVSKKGCRFASEWYCWLFDDGCQFPDDPECFE